eukprot:5049483-Heterocapsa_arctica.AAC.1
MAQQPAALLRVARACRPEGQRRGVQAKHLSQTTADRLTLIYKSQAASCMYSYQNQHARQTKTKARNAPS